MTTLPQFDPLEWVAKISDVDDRVSLVMGPRNALELIAARRRILAEFTPPESAAADIFLFGIGEAPVRSGTKVGGLPYLEKSDSWPLGRDGRPLPFIAQFNFTESRDHVGHLVSGDILLLFGHMPTDQYEDVDIVLLWKSTEVSGHLVVEQDVPIWPKFDPFFGVRWRTMSYDLYDHLDRWTVNKDVEAQEACTPFATQIGALPFIFGRSVPPFDGDALCCLTPINPTTSKSYPFINYPRPILSGGWGSEPEEDFLYEPEAGVRFPDKWQRWGDSTSLYIFRSYSGELAIDWIDD